MFNIENNFPCDDCDRNSCNGCPISQEVEVEEPEGEGYWLDSADQGEFDGDALVSAGMGTDEDYGYYDSFEDWAE